MGAGAAVEVEEVGAAMVLAPAPGGGAEPGTPEAAVEVGAMEVEMEVREPSSRPPEVEGATLVAGTVGKEGTTGAGAGAGSAGSGSSRAFLICSRAAFFSKSRSVTVMV